MPTHSFPAGHPNELAISHFPLSSIGLFRTSLDKWGFFPFFCWVISLDSFLQREELKRQLGCNPPTSFLPVSCPYLGAHVSSKPLPAFPTFTAAVLPKFGFLLLLQVLPEKKSRGKNNFQSSGTKKVLVGGRGQGGTHKFCTPAKDKA